MHRDGFMAMAREVQGILSKASSREEEAGCSRLARISIGYGTGINYGWLEQRQVQHADIVS